MNVLVAGGAGYIGSHTVKRLKEAGHKPVIYDNLSRGHRSVVDILKVPAVAADLNDRHTLREHAARAQDRHGHALRRLRVRRREREKPLMYYQNNVATTISVLRGDAGGGREPVRLLQHLRRLRRPRHASRSPKTRRKRRSARTAEAS